MEISVNFVIYFFLLYIKLGKPDLLFLNRKRPQFVLMKFA